MCIAALIDARTSPVSRERECTVTCCKRIVQKAMDLRWCCSLMVKVCPGDSTYDDMHADQSWEYFHLRVRLRVFGKRAEKEMID